MHIRFFVPELLHVLHSGGAVLGGASDTPPTAGILRATKPKIAHGRSRVGNTLEDLQRPVRYLFSIALKPALFYPDLGMLKICDGEIVCL